MLRRRGCYGVVGVFQTKKSERKREDTEVLVKGKVIRYERYQDCGKCIPRNNHHKLERGNGGEQFNPVEGHEGASK